MKHPADGKIVDFQEHLALKMAEEKEAWDSMDRDLDILAIVARAIAEMRAVGANSQEIVHCLSFAIDGLTHDGQLTNASQLDTLHGAVPDTNQGAELIDRVEPVV